MKSSLRFAILVLAALTFSSTAFGTEKAEFRAVWVQTWLPGMLCPSEVDQTVQWAKGCNMNVLIAQVRRLGDAYYCSEYEPRGCNISAGPDYDPLDYVIKQAKANGMEVHAWMNLFRVNSKGVQQPDPKHVINQHPEWLSKDYAGNSAAEEGQFIDPGVPEAREYLVKVVADLLSKYDVQGLMLDYVRYPGKDWGYNKIAVSRFNEKYGRTGKPAPDDPQWSDWRREQVTETVRAISQEVHRLKPHIKLSAATIAWGKCPSTFRETSAYKAVFQDWRLWMEEGIIDANMPMNYKNPSDPKQNRWFAEWVAGAKKWSYGRHVYCGLMLYKSVPGAARQAFLARIKGADGVVGLAFSQLESKSSLASRLKSLVFSRPVPIPQMPWKKAEKAVSSDLADYERMNGRVEEWEGEAPAEPGS